NTVLYEGYILYPYRPSVKNRQRWTFGGLYPEAYCQAQAGSDASANQTECLVEGGPHTNLDVLVRFLRLTERAVGELLPSLQEWPARGEPTFRPVESLHLGGQSFHAWQEAEEYTEELKGTLLGDIAQRPRRHAFSLPARRWLEPLREPDGDYRGVLVRTQET